MTDYASLCAEAPAGQHRLHRLFEPGSIALVGASEKSPWSRFIIRNYADFGYDGRLFAVNRGGATVHGIRGYTSCVAIGEPVDVAFIFVPQAAVLTALEDVAAAGIRAAAILSSGYAETGADGAAAQRELLDCAGALGVTIWGPNSLGFNNVSARTPVSAIPAVLPILPPMIAVVSQSGATAAELNEFAHSQNIGTSFVAATGNEGQITLADVVDYLVDHAPTRAIAIFAETVRDPATFARAAERARAKAKPIVILKIGRSALATAVAKAHTGSLVGDDNVFDAVCERLGVIRVQTAEELINVAGLLAATGPLPAAGLGFVSISGGACTLVADGAEAAGVRVPPNSTETITALERVLPSFASTLNPLDVTGAAIVNPGLFEEVIPVLASAPEIGLIGIGMTVPTMEGQGHPPALSAIGRAVPKLRTPVIMVATCQKALNEISRRAIADYGLPHVVTGVAPMLHAAGKAAWWSAQLDRAPATLLLDPAPISARDRLGSERAALDHLASFGVPVIPGTVARSSAEARAIAEAIEGPLALKISSPDIAHKTEVGGVRLNVASTDAGAAFDSIVADVAHNRPDAAIDGVIVSPMRAPEIELLVGVTRDPSWGPTIAIGLGGVLVELLADVVIAPLPVTRADVVAMLGRLRGARLLDGYRGNAAANVDSLAQAIVAIGEAAVALGPNLASLEVNPLLVGGDRIEALDALVVWDEEETLS